MGLVGVRQLKELSDLDRLKLRQGHRKPPQQLHNRLNYLRKDHLHPLLALVSTLMKVVNNTLRILHIIWFSSCLRRFRWLRIWRYIHDSTYLITLAPSFGSPSFGSAGVGSGILTKFEYN